MFFADYLSLSKNNKSITYGTYLDIDKFFINYPIYRYIRSGVGTDPISECIIVEYEKSSLIRKARINPDSTYKPKIVFTDKEQQYIDEACDKFLSEPIKLIDAIDQMYEYYCFDYAYMKVTIDTLTTVKYTDTYELANYIARNNSKTATTPLEEKNELNRGLNELYARERNGVTCLY